MVFCKKKGLRLGFGEIVAFMKFYDTVNKHGPADLGLISPTFYEQLFPTQITNEQKDIGDLSA